MSENTTRICGSHSERMSGGLVSLRKKYIVHGKSKKKDIFISVGVVCVKKGQFEKYPSKA